MSTRRDTDTVSLAEKLLITLEKRMQFNTSCHGRRDCQLDCQLVGLNTQPRPKQLSRRLRSLDDFGRDTFNEQKNPSNGHKNGGMILF
jgi:hypothetical protein